METPAVLKEYTALDARDDACSAIKTKLEEEGHSVLVAYSNRVGCIYVDGVGPLYLVEVHAPE